MSYLKNYIAQKKALIKSLIEDMIQNDWRELPLTKQYQAMISMRAELTKHTKDELEQLKLSRQKTDRGNK